MQQLLSILADGIFDFCCQAVSWFAKLCGSTYYEMNTYLFIVVQPLVYVLLSLVILYYAAKWLKKGKHRFFFAALGYAFFNVLCFFCKKEFATRQCFPQKFHYLCTKQFFSAIMRRFNKTNK